MEDRGITCNTRKRYFEAVRKILPRLEATELSWDAALVSWIEEQYSAGEGITHVSDTLCGLQHFAPFCKGRLVRAWRLFKVWRRVEKPAQAPPLPILVFLGLLGRCVELEDLTMSVLLILGFWGMLRTGELLKLEIQHVLLGQHTVVVQLGRTKTGLRRAVDENIVLYEEVPRLIIKAFLEQHHDAPLGQRLWQHSPEMFRSAFRQLLSFFKVEHLFRPYSMRRGGATEDFRQHGLMEKTLLRGRWGTTTAARQYVQEGLSALTAIRIEQQRFSLLQRYAVFYFGDLTNVRSDPGDVENPAGGVPEKKSEVKNSQMARRKRTKTRWSKSGSAK